MSTHESDELLGLTDAALELALTYDAVRRLACTHELDCRRVGHRLLVTRESVEQYSARRQRAAQP